MEEQIQEVYEELLNYIDSAPIDISTAIYHEVLWELSEDECNNRLQDKADFERDAIKNGDYND
jgi:hypothetical protein